MSKFATLLETHEGTLVKRWVNRVRDDAHVYSTSPTRLRARLPLLLRGLILSLRRGTVRDGDGVEAPVLQFGFDVKAVVREYGLLASLLLDFATEAGTDLSTAEVNVFTGFMSSIVADGVAVHALFREEADRVAEQTAQSERLQADAVKDRRHQEALDQESASAHRSETARNQAELARDGLLEALKAQPLLQVVVLEGPNHVVTLMNSEYQKNVAGGRDLVGMPVLAAFPQLAGHGYDTIMRGVLETGTPFVARDVQMPIDRGTGVLETRFMDFVIQPVRGRFGTVDSLLAISLDVSRSVEARLELEAFVAQEEERAELERQIIGVVSHDLGNPLAVIKLAVGQLLTQRLPPETTPVVERIKGTLERMGHLVDDLLDFTQARVGGGLSIVREPANVHDVIRKVVEELRLTFPSRELHFETEGDGEGRWDRGRLSQAAVNLIANALKYGAANASVQVRTRGFTDHVELEVFNRGEPISPEILPVLFEPMQRGHPRAPQLGRSVGLGLYIVKHIVDAKGGTISVTSTAEAGTRFILSLPRHRQN